MTDSQDSVPPDWGALRGLFIRMAPGTAPAPYRTGDGRGGGGAPATSALLRSQLALIRQRSGTLEGRRSALADKQKVRLNRSPGRI